jgi:hypothetical protein
MEFELKPGHKSREDGERGINMKGQDRHIRRIYKRRWVNKIYYTYMTQTRSGNLIM